MKLVHIVFWTSLAASVASLSLSVTNSEAVGTSLKEINPREIKPRSLPLLPYVDTRLDYETALTYPDLVVFEIVNDLWFGALSATYILRECSIKYPLVKFMKIKFHKLEEVTGKIDVKRAPAIVFMKNSRKLDTMYEIDASKINDALDRYTKD